ncbi:MAG: chemotaxis protein CheD [Campylobacterota bacterium]|nr:chemotaxis protein CheD [Campylobacterota bacterium]
MEFEKKFIHSSQLYVATEPTEIHTVLGSCVAVCLVDQSTFTAGMNHYLLPLWNNDGIPSPKFGNISIVKLIEAMEQVGCKRKNIIAKVFGGSSPSGLTSSQVGSRNIEIAEDILSDYGIKIVGKDVEGINSRKIVLNSVNGKVILKYPNKR